jgi:hypothetical protein
MTWREYQKMKGHKVYEILIPVTKIIEWIKKRRKKPAETEWAYEGCGCVPEEGYRSTPYCAKHFNKLGLREVV